MATVICGAFYLDIYWKMHLDLVDGGVFHFAGLLKLWHLSFLEKHGVVFGILYRSADPFLFLR
jgi:hypothetical protein